VRSRWIAGHLDGGIRKGTDVEPGTMQALQPSGETSAGTAGDACPVFDRHSHWGAMTRVQEHTLALA
jgi:hypothetical protein